MIAILADDVHLKGKPLVESLRELKALVAAL